MIPFRVGNHSQWRMLIPLRLSAQLCSAILRKKPHLEGAAETRDWKVEAFAIPCLGGIVRLSLGLASGPRFEGVQGVQPLTCHAGEH